MPRPEITSTPLTENPEDSYRSHGYCLIRIHLNPPADPQIPKYLQGAKFVTLGIVDGTQTVSRVYYDPKLYFNLFSTSLPSSRREVGKYLDDFDDPENKIFIQNAVEANNRKRTYIVGLKRI